MQEGLEGIQAVARDSVSQHPSDTEIRDPRSWVYVATGDRGVLYSADGGTTFRPFNQGLISLRVLDLVRDPTHPDRLLAATGNGVFELGGAAEPCAASATRLCLLDRFEAEVSWTDFSGATGSGKVVPLTDNTGAFWFFGEDNVELAIKILDGRPINGHYWFFMGSLSNVGFDLTVTDTVTGERRVLVNPRETFASQVDLELF